jgi:CheY-like chemotaxis protein
MNLYEVAVWLRGLEDLAHAVYKDAAESDVADGEFRAFLNRIAQDEAHHYHLMGSAAELIRRHGEPQPSMVLVDAEVKGRIEGPLRDLQTQLRRDRLTEQRILEAICESENSEWNDIFLYVINHCVGISPNFQYVASTLQAHEKQIEKFLAAKDTSGDLTNKLSSLPEIWKNRLLVIEDDPAIRLLLVRALDRYGQVTAVKNCEEGLAQIRQGFFNAVVTDVDISETDGFSRLWELVAEDDIWRTRFIVFAASVTEDVSKVTKEEGIPLLTKPVSIHLLRKTVEEILAAEAS